NALLTRRLYADAVDALFASINSGGTKWILTDRIGSVRDIAGSTGSLVDHRDYSSFGKLTNETQPTNGDRYGFTRREYDSDTGLLFARTRYYSVDTGRWTSQDPIRFAGGDTNLYRYVFNTPVN